MKAPTRVARNICFSKQRKPLQDVVQTTQEQRDLRQRKPWMHNGVVCYVVHTSTTLHIEPRYSPHIHIYFRLHTSSSGETLFFVFIILIYFLRLRLRFLSGQVLPFSGKTMALWFVFLVFDLIIFVLTIIWPITYIYIYLWKSFEPDEDNYIYYIGISLQFQIRKNCIRKLDHIPPKRTIKLAGA